MKRLCGCVRSRCCSYPVCPLYNELILSAGALAALGARAVDAVYFLEGEAAASNESAALAEAEARLLHALLGKEGLAPPLLALDWRAAVPFRPVTGNR